MTSQLPFLHSFNDIVPPSEAWLYGCINWFLAEAQQQSSIGLSQSSTVCERWKTKLKAGLRFNVQKQPVTESSSGPLAEKPHLDTRTESNTD